MSDDEVQCPCCGLFYLRHDPPVYAPRRVPLHFQLGVCWDCANHQGDSAEVAHVRGRQHGQLLRREYLAARERIEAARQEVLEMERELAMRPVQVRVRIENLDKVIVDEAVKDRDEAYRRRDVAMGALSDVRLLHHKDPKDRERCICGTRYAQCDMAQIADRWGGVEAWEMSQAGRAARGYRHYLDRAHPALKDADWFDNVYREGS